MNVRGITREKHPSLFHRGTQPGINGEGLIQTGSYMGLPDPKRSRTRASISGSRELFRLAHRQAGDIENDPPAIVVQRGDEDQSSPAEIGKQLIRRLLPTDFDIGRDPDRIERLALELQLHGGANRAVRPVCPDHVLKRSRLQRTGSETQPHRDRRVSLIVGEKLRPALHPHAAPGQLPGQDGLGMRLIQPIMKG